MQGRPNKNILPHITSPKCRLSRKTVNLYSLDTLLRLDTECNTPDNSVNLWKRSGYTLNSLGTLWTRVPFIALRTLWSWRSQQTK